MNSTDKVKVLIQKLVGECPTGDCRRFDELAFFEKGSNIGYSQFNEILLLLGFDRVTQSFFQFLVDGTTEYINGSALKSINQLEKGVTEFRKLAILLYANVKYGFKELARNTDELEYQLETMAKLKQSDFNKRHKPVLKIETIKPEDTYLLGYKIREKISDALNQNPNDHKYKPLEEKRLKVRMLIPIMLKKQLLGSF